MWSTHFEFCELEYGWTAVRARSLAPVLAMFGRHDKLLQPTERKIAKELARFQHNLATYGVMGHYQMSTPQQIVSLQLLQCEGGAQLARGRDLKMTREEMRSLPPELAGGGMGLSFA